MMIKWRNEKNGSDANGRQQIFTPQVGNDGVVGFRQRPIAVYAGSGFYPFRSRVDTRLKFAMLKNPSRREIYYRQAQIIIFQVVE